MFKRLVAGFALMLICAAGGAVPPLKVMEDNTAFCPRAEKAPVIDGRLDDPCWRSDPRITRFMLLDEYKPPHERTSVHLAYDEKALYVAFTCAEPEISKLKTTEKTTPWKDDSVEVFIDADRGRVRYFRFVADAGGAKYQETGENVRENLNQTWQAPWDAAVSTGNAEWIAEIRIPWAALGITPRDGLAIRANFGRNETALPEISTWNVMPGGFHQPLKFGNVVLASAARPLVSGLLLPREAVPGQITGELTLTNAAREPMSVWPIVRVLPSKSGMPKPGQTSRMEPGWILKCPVTLDLPESKLYGLDVYVQEEGASAPTFLASWQVTVPEAPAP